MQLSHRSDGKFAFYFNKEDTRHIGDNNFVTVTRTHSSTLHLAFFKSTAVRQGTAHSNSVRLMQWQKGKNDKPEYEGTKLYALLSTDAIGIAAIHGRINSMLIYPQWHDDGSVSFQIPEAFFSSVKAPKGKAIAKSIPLINNEYQEAKNAIQKINSLVSMGRLTIAIGASGRLEAEVMVKTKLV